MQRRAEHSSAAYILLPARSRWFGVAVLSYRSRYSFCTRPSASRGVGAHPASTSTSLAIQCLSTYCTRRPLSPRGSVSVSLGLGATSLLPIARPTVAQTTGAPSAQCRATFGVGGHPVKSSTQDETRRGEATRPCVEVRGAGS